MAGEPKRLKVDATDATRQRFDIVEQGGGKYCVFGLEEFDTGDITGISQSFNISSIFDFFDSHGFYPDIFQALTNFQCEAHSSHHSMLTLFYYFVIGKISSDKMCLLNENNKKLRPTDYEAACDACFNCHTDITDTTLLSFVSLAEFVDSDSKKIKDVLAVIVEGMEANSNPAKYAAYAKLLGLFSNKFASREIDSIVSTAIEDQITVVEHTKNQKKVLGECVLRLISNKKHQDELRNRIQNL
jgi:hypothetical protein